MVADDASTDETAGVLAAWKRRYPCNLSVVPITASRGVAAAKNDAIRRAIGEYVALHDADDEFRPSKLVRCYAALRAPSRPDLVTHDYLYVEDDTGRTEVPEPDWCGGWRPPGVWVFPSGTVIFNEQMVSGYEELEWSVRRWRRLRRVHVPEVLSTVHGTSVADRWKFERQIAGAASMTRWNERAGGDEARAFACRHCGNQYLRRAVCCGQRTEAVPLVCYMVAASSPRVSPVPLSVILAVGSDLARVRRVRAALASTPAGSAAEWIFVHCHPRPDLLRYLAAQPTRIPVKAIFTPPGHPLVYSHDVNRGARAALGRDLLVVAAQPRTTASTIRTRGVLGAGGAHGAGRWRRGRAIGSHGTGDRCRLPYDGRGRDAPTTCSSGPGVGPPGCSSGAAEASTSRWWAIPAESGSGLDRPVPHRLGAGIDGVRDRGGDTPIVVGDVDGGEEPALHAGGLRARRQVLDASLDRPLAALDLGFPGLLLGCHGASPRTSLSSASRLVLSTGD